MSDAGACVGVRVAVAEGGTEVGVGNPVVGEGETEVSVGEGAGEVACPTPL